MIAHLSGTTIFVGERFAIVETSGVGYKVRLPAETLQSLQKNNGEKVSLWIHTAVREDAIDLYGFEAQETLDFFEMLISVSGIGPKGAIGILNVAPVEHLKEAISKGDISALTKVSGIGSKSAQKIVLELKDKLGEYRGEGEQSALGDDRDVLEGLVALGYAERVAREALKNVSVEVKGTSARIKDALKRLGK